MRGEQKGCFDEDSREVERWTREGRLHLKELGPLVVELQLELGQWLEGRH